MNLQQRLTVLERQTLNQEPRVIAIKPKDWSEGEYKAVIKGLGLKEANTVTFTEPFIAKYQIYIDQIRADYNEQSITPDKPLIKAQPLSFGEIIEYDKAKYFDD